MQQVLLGVGAGVVPPAGSWVTAVSWTPHGNSTGWGAYTARQIFGSSVMVAGSKIRLTLRALGAGVPVNIGNMYAGVQASSGNVYDFAATPQQVLFSGSGTLSMTGDSSVVSDEIILPISSGQGLVVAAYFNGTTILAINGVPGSDNHYKSGNDASTVDGSGYTVSGNSRALITKVEVFQP